MNSMAWKLAKMSKVHASSNEYPYIKIIKNLREQNFKFQISGKQQAIG